MQQQQQLVEMLLTMLIRLAHCCKFYFKLFLCLGKCGGNWIIKSHGVCLLD